MPDKLEFLSPLGLAIVAALKSCELDCHRFCRRVQPGGGRVFHCLAENARELRHPAMRR